MGTEYVAVAFTILFTIATSVLLGRLHVRRCSPASARCSIPCSCRSSGSCCALTGVDPDEQQDWKQYSVSLLDLERLHVARHVDDRHAAAVPAAQSRRHRQHGADARVQHDLELHHQHEPAALQRRDGAVVPLADVRDHRSCSS